jgi:hypothetical protein
VVAVACTLLSLWLRRATGQGLSTVNEP